MIIGMEWWKIYDWPTVVVLPKSVSGFNKKVKYWKGHDNYWYMINTYIWKEVSVIVGHLYYRYRLTT